MGLYAIIMLLNMKLENTEDEPVFEPDGDPKFPWGTGGSDFWNARKPTFHYGDAVTDVTDLEPPHARVPTLVTRAQFEKAYAEHNGNLREVAKEFGFHQQTAVNYAIRWDLEIGDVGRPSDLTPLLPDIAAARADGTSWKQLEEELGFDRRAMQQALSRHGYKK